MNVIRKVLLLGDQMLRKRSAKIDPTSNSARRIERDLRDTLRFLQKKHGYGRGLAAPQLGFLKRMVFLKTRQKETLLTNPKVVWKSRQTFPVWDSCFSFNVAFFVLVQRAKSIAVEYEDERGEKKMLRASSGISELLQHELDHLEGVLAVDRGKTIVMRESLPAVLKKRAS